MITTKPTVMAKPQRLGWLPELPDHRDYPFIPLLQLQSGLPDPDKLILPWVPLPTDQFQWGSCVANAVGAAIHFAQIKSQQPAFFPSRMFLYYCARELIGYENFDLGCYIRDGFKSAANLGVCKEDDYPYNSAGLSKPPPEVYEKAKQHRTWLYRRVSNELADMKACLQEGYPFVFGFSVYSSFNWAGPDINLPNPDDTLLGGHAVLCIGYDDDTQRFTFLNSWGPQFGTSGRGTIPYAYLTNPNLSDDFWTLSATT